MYYRNQELQIILLQFLLPHRCNLQRLNSITFKRLKNCSNAGFKDRILSTISPDGNIISIRKYDEMGNLKKEVDGLRYSGNIDTSPGTEHTYDLVERLTEVKDSLGNRTKYEYDVFGRVVKITNARQKETNYEYYIDGSLKNVKYADGGIVEYTYNRLGQKITEKDQRNNTTTYLNYTVNNCACSSSTWSVTK